MRVAVIGLGGTGTAAARFLAADGHTVVGYEQFHLNHDRGSSYGASRIIRRVYPDPLYASLMDAAYPLWHELERESGDSLLLQCGGFFFGTEGHEEMVGVENALTEVGVPYQRWSAAEAGKHVPPFRLTAEEYGVFEPESGLLRASRCVLANARGARALGADLREGVRIEAIEPATSGVIVKADGVAETFDRVLVTAGPWMGAMLAPWVTLPLRVSRQQYAHFEVLGDRAAFAPDRFPVWIDMERHFYGFPEHDGIPGAKVAYHFGGTTHDPNSPDREPHEEDDTFLRNYLEHRLPEATGPVTVNKVCLYTMTPDTDFIVDRLPGEPSISFISGCSGHGFKFTVLLGRIGATLASDGEPPYDLARFRLSRFETEAT